MAGDVTLSAAPLADLCHLLGITTSELAAAEDADVLAYTFPVAAAHAARLKVEHVQAFVEQYGAAARVELRTGELIEITLGPGITDAEVEAFAQSAGSGGPYEAMVYVDKNLMSLHLVGTSPVRRIRVFLFAESLRRILASGIARFETSVWTEASEPLVIAVLDTNISLTGDQLTIIGGGSLLDAATAASRPPTTQDFEALIASRDHQIGWDMPWTKSLTPWHFALTGTCDDPALLGLFRAQLVKLAVLFTCDRARARSGSMPPEILAEYRGRDHTAVIPIDEHKPLDCTDTESSAVLRAVTWCYAHHGANGQPDWVSDRLPFIQTQIAQALEPRPSSERLSAFVKSMHYLLERLEWHWKAFIEGKVGEYLDRVQQVEAIVSDTVSAFADRTATLATALTQTTLAAVAVLIGSFIAAAFRSPFNTALFRIGVLTYAGYVVLFPGGVGLLSSSCNLRSARSEFDTRVARFNEILYPEKVTEIVGPRVADAQRSYYRWLTLVAIIYIVVAIVACFAAANVPHLVIHQHSSH